MRWAVALLCLAGALVAPAGAAAFPDAQFENQCQYSYDRGWRPVPMVFGGRLTNGSGTELTPGAQLSVGDTVRLEGGTVSAILPSWITSFAYAGELIPLGDGEIPVKAWLALEGTNTVEGVKSGILLDTVARTHVVLGPGGVVDEQRSSVLVDRAPIPPQTWTASGGEVRVTQALAESLPPLPVGEGGTTTRVHGSLFVDAHLITGSGFVNHLYLDCLQGRQVREGETHTDELPGALGQFSVPGYAGEVDGTPVTGRVDADLLAGEGPPRVAAGGSATLRNGALRLRLTDAQRDAWFGGATQVALSGSVALEGLRSAEQVQDVALDHEATVAGDGPVTVTIPLPETTWTALGAEGIDVRSERSLVLDATVGATTRRLTLTRVSAADPYPFARLLRPAAPPTKWEVRPPAPQPTPVPTPPVAPVPTVAPPKVAVRSSALKVKSNRVSAALSCAGASMCRGTVSLRTAKRVRKRYVTLTRSVKYAVAAGERTTVRLTLSRAGKTYLRGRKRVRVTLTLKPSEGKTVTKQLTLTR